MLLAIMFSPVRNAQPFLPRNDPKHDCHSDSRSGLLCRKWQENQRQAVSCSTSQTPVPATDAPLMSGGHASCLRLSNLRELNVSHLLRKCAPSAAHLRSKCETE